jgi:THO complex subunit 3
VALPQVAELVCVRTCTRHEWPIRTLSFSSDGAYLGIGSEDPFLEIASVATGERAHLISPTAPMNGVAFNPKQLLLAYASEEKGNGRDGAVRVFGWPSN